jgi:DNA-binding response OmpR family regulator
MNTPHILVCDDEEHIRESIRLILERKNYILSLAATAQEALQQVKSNQPDLILLDIGMPQEKGLDILSQIKSLSPKTEIIIVSGYRSNGEIAKKIEQFGASYLNKPFKRDELLAKIETVLSKRAKNNL